MKFSMNGLLRGVVLADDLDGDTFDKAAGAVLLGLVDNAHAAFEDLANDVVAQLALDGEQNSHGWHVV